MEHSRPSANSSVRKHIHVILFSNVSIQTKESLNVCLLNVFATSFLECIPYTQCVFRRLSIAFVCATARVTSSGTIRSPRTAHHKQ